MPDYTQVRIDSTLEGDLRSLVRLSIAEDLRQAVDWTTVCLVDADREGGCEIVPREAGICAGVQLLDVVVDEFDADLQVECLAEDRGTLVPGRPIARLRGNVRDLLTSERIILNLLSRLCGIATLTSRYVAELSGTKTRLYDTRKTTPGWRLLEKYAVGCGGGMNHRSGLFDGFLVKDNHLALAGDSQGAMSARSAAERALSWRLARVENMTAPSIVEIEIDRLDQLTELLPVGPDMVLLDNFSLQDLAEAVKLRDQLNPSVELEASGNVRIDTIAKIAATGVDRISSGALTHQATSLDLGLDWFDATAS